MEDSNLLIGAMFSAIFIGSALWHMRENALLERHLDKKTDSNTSQWLVRFAWARTMQLLGALACIILLIISYDRELQNIRSSLDALTAAVAQREWAEQKQAADAKAAAAAAAPVQQPAIANPAPPAPPLQQAASPAPAQPPLSQIPPSANAAALEPAAQPAITLQQTGIAAAMQNQVDAAVLEQGFQDQDIPPQANAPAGNTANETINALYSPERSGKDHQSSMDDIKRRYEDILVIYMFLKKCGKIQPSDYNTITSALAQEMAAVNAPGRLQYDILASAQGSYSEIYSQSPCDGKGIADLNTQYINYIEVLASSFPPPGQ